ncbi:BON domain-containing protein [Haoranjiania flava]|uniref:BON domain-containing protein n=1 Tax=Haoranjiania flava TaxID=1856322 RepID=A0AAE3IPH8_9BACT|nr:BON domain-containing protein [Haoranjiania flava]MCU7695479.1 BON domain-containing protein [Haoranjiania flava]
MKLTKMLPALILAGSLVVALPACKSKVDDTAVKANVENALTSAPGVTVDVKDGVVTLSGAVADDATKTQAESAVNALKTDAKSGVKSVVNNITVTPPTVAVSPDATLQTGVATVVKDFPGVNATVANGVITVTGSLEKARVQTLKQALDALSPQRTDMSQLKVK